MAHGVGLMIAATRALDTPPHGLGGTALAAVVLAIVLGVATMFWLLFWSNWGRQTDPTDEMEHRRRGRFAGLHQRTA
jgi:membrane protein implicated in regulation of membrane protease activity